MTNELFKCQEDVKALRTQVKEAQGEMKKAQAAADQALLQAQAAVAAATQRSQSNGAGEHHEGTLSADAATKVIQTNLGGLRGCYERGLKRNPNLQFVSRINARFAVKNSGGAINVDFSPHSDHEMERCMAQAIGRWRFPSFSGDPVQIDYPVSLVVK